VGTEKCCVSIHRGREVMTCVVVVIVRWMLKMMTMMRGWENRENGRIGRLVGRQRQETSTDMDKTESVRTNLLQGIGRDNRHLGVISFR